MLEAEQGGYLMTGFADELGVFQQLVIANSRIRTIETDRADDATSVIEVRGGDGDSARKDFAAADRVTISLRRG